MSYLNHSNYSVIEIDGNTNNGTLIEDSNSYDEKLMNGLVYFGVSLLFGVPILMFLLCVYKMRGVSPCNLKEACCCEFC
jgi:hypothetical protein